VATTAIHSPIPANFIAGPVAVTLEHLHHDKFQIIMEVIGKPTINPLLFYSGKISGYIVWILFLFSIFKVDFLPEMIHLNLNYLSYFLMNQFRKIPSKISKFHKKNSYEILITIFSILDLYLHIFNKL